MFTMKAFFIFIGAVTLRSLLSDRLVFCGLDLRGRGHRCCSKDDWRDPQNDEAIDRSIRLQETSGLLTPQINHWRVSSIHLGDIADMVPCLPDPSTRLRSTLQEPIAQLTHYPSPNNMRRGVAGWGDGGYPCPQTPKEGSAKMRAKIKNGTLDFDAN